MHELLHAQNDKYVKKKNTKRFYFILILVLL